MTINGNTRTDWCLDWYNKVHEYAFRMYPNHVSGGWYQNLDRKGNRIHFVVQGLAVKDPFHLPRSLLYCWGGFWVVWGKKDPEKALSQRGLALKALQDDAGFLLGRELSVGCVAMLAAIPYCTSSSTTLWCSTTLPSSLSSRFIVDNRAKRRLMSRIPPQVNQIIAGTPTERYTQAQICQNREHVSSERPTVNISTVPMAKTVAKPRFQTTAMIANILSLLVNSSVMPRIFPHTDFDASFAFT